MIKIFDIAERHFVLVGDLKEFDYCTSPLFSTSGAVGGSDLLATKARIFCYRPSVNPPVRPLYCKPAAIGLMPAQQKPQIDEPYIPATLNAVGCPHTGVWRHLTCVCPGCAATTEANDVECTGFDADSAWAPYSVQRSPPSVGKQGDRSFISLFVDHLLGNAVAAAAVATFLRTQFHRFNGQAKALAFVNRRDAALRAREDL
jgi:hypothetical protein